MSHFKVTASCQQGIKMCRALLSRGQEAHEQAAYFYTWPRLGHCFGQVSVCSFLHSIEARCSWTPQLHRHKLLLPHHRRTES